MSDPSEWAVERSKLLDEMVSIIEEAKAWMDEDLEGDRQWLGRAASVLRRADSHGAFSPKWQARLSAAGRVAGVLTHAPPAGGYGVVLSEYPDEGVMGPFLTQAHAEEGRAQLPEDETHVIELSPEQGRELVQAARQEEIERFIDEDLPALRAVARGLGYALAVHGSLARDLDIVAAPWVPEAAGAEDLADAIREAVNGAFGSTFHGVVESKGSKPHGRRTWIVQTGHFAGPLIDLSVMPRGGDYESDQDEKGRHEPLLTVGALQVAAIADAWVVRHIPTDTWWRAHQSGYTSELVAAGVYTEEEAKSCERRRSQNAGVYEDRAIRLLDALRGLGSGTVGRLVGLAAKGGTPPQEP